MTAREEVRDRARLFGWSVHTDPVAGDTYLYGDRAVIAHYTKDGSVRSAELYTFFSINDMHLKDRAPGKNKKSAVISWLAEAG
jgi:hypothetical protein